MLHERRAKPFRMRPPIPTPGPPPANLGPVAPPRPLRAPAGVSAAQSSRRRVDPPASASRKSPRRTRCAAQRSSVRPAHLRSSLPSQPGIARNGDTEISNRGLGVRRRSTDRRSSVVLSAESASGAATDASAGATRAHWTRQTAECARRYQTGGLTNWTDFPNGFEETDSGGQRPQQRSQTTRQHTPTDGRNRLSG